MERGGNTIDTVQDVEVSDIVWRTINSIGENLGFDLQTICEILGMAEGVLNSLEKDDYSLFDEEICGRGQQFLEIYRVLHRMMGGDLQHCERWFKSENAHVGGVPLDLCKTQDGLDAVSTYVAQFADR